MGFGFGGKVKGSSISPSLVLKDFQLWFVWQGWVKESIPWISGPSRGETRAGKQAGIGELIPQVGKGSGRERKKGKVLGNRF